MPCNYKNYPPNWFTEIRPRILERAKNCCEQCFVKNYEIILRGEWAGVTPKKEPTNGVSGATKFNEKFRKSKRNGK